MGYILLGSVYHTITYLLLLFIMQYICSAHINLIKKNIVICTAVSLIGNFIFLIFNHWITGILPVILIFLSVLIFSSRKGRDLLLFFPAFALYCAISVIPDALLSTLYPNISFDLIINGSSIHLLGLVCDSILLIIFIFLRHILLKYETSVHLTAKEIWGCIGLLFFSIIDGGLIVLINRSNMRSTFLYIWNFILIGALIFAIGYYIFCLTESRVRIYRQSISRNETEYLRVQLDALQDSKDNEELVKQLRHDLNNHLGIIHSLCEDGNYEAVKDYTEQLRHDITPTGANILSGNNVADLVIRSKLKIAQEHGIDFTFSGSLAQLNQMDAPDICGLFANAYDNAIEACLTQKNPYIRTMISTTQNYTVIQIINSIQNKITIRDNRIVTTKKDKQSHGYGIDIMKRITHKYNGKFTLRSSDNELTVKIVLLT